MGQYLGVLAPVCFWFGVSLCLCVCVQNVMSSLALSDTDGKRPVNTSEITDAMCGVVSKFCIL